jgi:hypothetical protein
MSSKNSAEIALDRLSSLGIDSKWLIENHSSQLKTLRLNADMGNADVPRNMDNLDDPLDLKSVAEFVIAQACEWPYKDEIYGINIEHAMRLAAEDYLATDRWFSLPYEKELSRSVAHGFAFVFDDALSRMKDISNLSDDVYITALLRNGLQLKGVPSGRITREMEHAAVKSNGNAIKYIDKTLRTPELIKCAVASIGSALAYLDSEEITHELADIAIETTPWIVCNIPPPMLTRSLVMKAASLDGMILDELSHDLVDRKVVQACVRQTPMALLVCPEHFMDATMLRYACKHHPEIKKELWVKDIALSLPASLSATKR